MKTLLLMRHAKAQPAEAGEDDHARPLNERGRKDAKHIAAQLAELKLLPAQVLSSTSERTKQTVNILVNELSYAGDVFFYNELYASNVERYVKTLRSAPSAEASPVLLVGHNPVVEDFLETICAVSEKMNTSAVAQIEFTINAWTEFDISTQGRLVKILRP